jgi:probable F420-dependent oxidoreductase
MWTPEIARLITSRWTSGPRCHCILRVQRGVGAGIPPWAHISPRRPTDVRIRRLTTHCHNAGVRIGLHALGIASGANPEVVAAVARSADTAGFSTLWCGEHIVMVDRPDSPYPYAADGRIAVPSDADWLDPFVTLSFAAAVTSKIRLGTGVLLLPEHNPLLVAKQAASLDLLSRGRFVLGIGIGWSSEEFAALGIPFQGRADRTQEYVDVMRTLWSSSTASYSGEFVQFEQVRSYPKPHLRAAIPVILGGNSVAALTRVAEYGDGWYGFNLAVHEVAGRINMLSQLCRQRGRDMATIEIAVSTRDGTPQDLDELEHLGVDQLVVVDSPPDGAQAAADWVTDLTTKWGFG